MAVVRVTPTGIMDKDTDVQYVGQGNYVDANDIRHRQTDGGNFAGVMSVLGNQSILTLSNYTSSSKKYRVYINLTGIANNSVNSNDGNLYIETSAGNVFSHPTNPVSITGTNIPAYVSTLQGYLNTVSNAAYGGVLTYAATVTTGTYTAYFDVTTSLDTDFILRVYNVQGELCTFKLLEEYVATGGSYKIVGSRQIDDKLIVFLASVALGTGISSFISEIGVIYSIDNGVTFLYNRLIKSKKLTFSNSRRIEAEIERSGSLINIYWTDNYNIPRAVKLNSNLILIPDALMFTYGGIYDLDEINSETSFFSKNSLSYISNVVVNNSGGNLTAGNKRYTGRFLTEDLIPTDFFYVSNPVNIYKASFTNPSLIVGDADGVPTDKSVTLKVNNITPGIYKFFELVVIEYQEFTPSMKIVQRYALNEQDRELTVTHTGLGEQNIVLSAFELLAITSKYLTVQSMRIFDNRMTISNLTEEVDLNLNSWAQQITHSVEQGFIESIGLAFELKGNLTKSFTDYKFGEYLDPNNVYENSSYVYNDTYRFGIQVQSKTTGKWSLPYWVDDIRIDASATNVIGSRRITSVGGVDTNLQDSSNNRVKYYYVKFHNIRLDDTIGGKKVRDVIDGFRFVRCKRIPEVLATGMFFAGSRPAVDARYATKPLVPFLKTGNGTVAGVASQNWSLGRAYTSGTAQVLAVGTSNTGSATAVCGGTSAADDSNYLYFYSPDLHYSNVNYIPDVSKDKIKLLARPSENPVYSGFALAGQRHATGSNTSAFTEYGGYFSGAGIDYTQFNVTHHAHIDTGSQVTLDSNVVSLSYYFTSTLQSQNPECEVFKISSKAHNNTAIADQGIWYGQLFRDLGANKKYPTNKELSIYESTGHIYYLTKGQNGVINNVNVKGGDSFIQKTTTALIRMPHDNSLWGMGYAVSFYSQNAGNYQMMNLLEHNLETTGPGYHFPQYLDSTNTATYWVEYTGSWVTTNLSAGTIGSGLMYWLEQWPEVSNQRNYGRSYNWRDETIVENGYDENNTYDGNLPVRIAWSAKKIIGSNKDNYRIFKPLEFINLDLTDGPITHHEIVNNSFYTWQPRSFQRQYFRDASMVSSDAGTDVVVGGGSILAAPGLQLSSVGLHKKWSIVKGKTPTGKESVYWFNENLQKMSRFGEDGTRIVSDKGLISYLVNNGKYLNNSVYPLTGAGVHAIWNDKYSEAIFTFKYNDGVTNKKFTLVYDEIKNGFICFHSYHPDIYLQYNNTFFSPDPLNPRNIYIHDRGSESTYYGAYTAPTITCVMNIDSNISKNFEALQFVTDKQPFHVDLTTSSHVSYLDNTDFDSREDFWYSPIKNDSTVGGLNNADTSRLWGKWLKVKMSLESSVGKQKLVNMIVKYRPMARLYNQ